MPFSITQFKGQLTGDGARPNLFEVQVPFVAGNDATQKMTFMCKGAQIPGEDIGLVEVPYFGRNIKLAGNRTFAEWTTTVINDENFAVWDGLVGWMNLINGHEENLQGLPSTPNGYQVNASVRQYGKTGDLLKNVEFVNLWPSSIPAIELGWDTNDAIEEFAVTWQYDYWQAIDNLTQTT